MGIEKLINQYGLENHIQLIKAAWMPAFIFRSKNGDVCNGHRTSFMQEMINENILFQGIVVPSLSFTNSEMEHLFNGFESCLSKYKSILKDGYENHLKGTPTKPVFRKFI